MCIRDRSKEVPFERVLFALGIRFVGETVAKKVAKSFKSMDALADASLDNLIQDVYKRQGYVYVFLQFLFSAHGS